MSYCPRWIYDAIFAQVGYDFIVSDLPLTLSAKKFASALSAKYEPLNIEEISEGCEEMIRFLAEVDANEARGRFAAWLLFFSIRYESQTLKRKMKPMFGAVDAGTKDPKYSGSDTVKRFKAYVFAWRSGTAILADHGWKLGDETALEELSKAANTQVSVLDAF